MFQCSSSIVDYGGLFPESQGNSHIASMIKVLI
jgi:hypothetical protein